MATDYFNKPRAADYFDNLLMNDTHKLFSKYAVHPADTSTDYLVDTSDAEIQPMRAALRIAQVEAGAVADDKRVAYGHMVKKTRTASLMSDLEGADCLFLQVSNAPKANWIPMYYLPWAPGKILHMTIPVRSNAANAGPQPDVFFTAAINGCSVFIQGTAKNPTIFHAGGNPVEKGRDTTKVWRQLVNLIKDPAKGKLQAEVNKEHHVTQWHMDQNMPRSTQKALDYEDYLKTNYNTGTVTIRTVSPWGCIFGIRDAQDDWNFYLQENATITVETITGTNTTTEHRRFKKDKVTTTDVVATQTYGRPMSVREFWPDGGGSVKITAPLPLPLNWTKL